MTSTGPGTPPGGRGEDGAIAPRADDLRAMELADAIALLGAPAPGDVPQVWVDLGCGTGTFTRALAHLLPPGSTIHAMDRNARALAALPAREGGVSVRPLLGDVVRDAWPWSALDGMLCANVLHFVPDQRALLARVLRHLHAEGHCRVVEYDATVPRPPWVPYPLGRAALAQVAAAAGFARTEHGSERPSAYGAAPLYAAHLHRR